MSKPKSLPILLLDIDGTLADWTRRAKAAGIEPDRQDSDAHAEWVKNVQNDDSLAEDPVIPLMPYLVCSLAKSLRIVYLTARHERHAAVTVAWLKKRGFPNGDLMMRKNADYRPTYVMKEGAINTIIDTYESHKIIAIDDDPSAEMSLVYRAYNIVHLKPTFCMFDEETGDVLPAYGSGPVKKGEAA